MAHKYSNKTMDEWREDLMAIANGEHTVGRKNHQFEQISWDPKKFRVISIDEKNGKITFEKIDQGEPG